ncbi:hypothetical protein Peur_031003 [Populus x canadensis]
MKMNRKTRNPSRNGEGRINDDNSKVLKDCGDMQPFTRSIRIRFPALEFLLGKFGGPSTVIYSVRHILCFFRNLKLAPNVALPNSRLSPEIEHFIY